MLKVTTNTAKSTTSPIWSSIVLMASAPVIAAETRIANNKLDEPGLLNILIRINIPRENSAANTSIKNKVIPSGPILSGVVPNNSKASPPKETTDQTVASMLFLFLVLFCCVFVSD